MKKVLSFVMAILFMLPCGGAKAVTTEPLPDGGKVLTYRYDELDELIEKHQTALNKLKSKKKLLNGAVEYTALPSGVISIFLGSGLLSAGIESFKNKKDKKTSAEAIKIGALGALGLLGGVGLCVLPFSIKDLPYANQIENMNLAINRINRVKNGLVLDMNPNMSPAMNAMLDRLFVTNLENVKENFFLRFFVDKNGFVYQEEENCFDNLTGVWFIGRYNLKEYESGYGICDGCYKFPE